MPDRLEAVGDGLKLDRDRVELVERRGQLGAAGASSELADAGAVADDLITVAADVERQDVRVGDAESDKALELPAQSSTSSP